MTRALLCVLAISLSACTAAQLRSHATATTIARSTLDIGADLAEPLCSEARFEQMGRDGVAPAEVETRIQNCQTVKGSHQTAVTAWTSYVTAVLQAATQRGRVQLTDVLRWAAQLITLYRPLREALETLGVEAPPLPAILGGE